MARPDPEEDTSRLLRDQQYDESLEVNDSEEVASVYRPSPRSPRQVTSGGRCQTPNSASVLNLQSRRSRGGRGLMSANSSSDEFDEDHKPSRAREPIGGQPGASPNEDEEEEEEEEEDDDEESDSDDTDDEDEPEQTPEGAYDPADYANLPVSTEVKELFQYITRYTPQSVELDHSLKPFIPDFIPAVGDIDAFLKVPRPDGKADGLGLVVLDEPSVKQSDPTVMSLWLSEDSKQHGATELKKVTSVARPESNPRAVDSWVESIGALHRSKPPASVQYGHAMPDIDSLMQEWPSELEELLGRVQLPPARLCGGLAQYVDVVCGMLDVPVHGSRVQSLHLLFSLYLEFRDSQHFTRRTHS
ncbi:intraflagellar transport protein 46 homolog isoform X1 [Scophthalmus maximus]|uniref:intraflagellar transport protein 46 homolog isoform X1 n=1 Tax=Scophthalmus maximus TaxID=52904 RepID=UPI0015E0E985|nr:intraflagellar transport protein 46 homolog isoform X1 [Scophthalmus maximus]XP_035506779.1 intraflagellar transport protein 46 homolog isoform X1 [Scophthalmus maximus]XP_035506780.1 intraflagellar transport protein 46 homolog isoform X1 [Scophthalmus maximus]XP_035506781.1 intraflagellar transport protein 46 homolog isoform X1 [Scophthalmus maximus]XP_035506782.1 intraflagellar transport protein 46 homolog isoform X1 [Scophthalmus maximus]XP_035506783.1 intraflagellar transport protein 46